jgi:hypothetical protein
MAPNTAQNISEIQHAQSISKIQRVVWRPNTGLHDYSNHTFTLSKSTSWKERIKKLPALSLNVHRSIYCNLLSCTRMYLTTVMQLNVINTSASQCALCAPVYIVGLVML